MTKNAFRLIKIQQFTSFGMVLLHQPLNPSPFNVQGYLVALKWVCRHMSVPGRSLPSGERGREWPKPGMSCIWTTGHFDFRLVNTNNNKPR